MKWTGKINLALATVAAVVGVAGAPAAKGQQKKPNIIVIFGDDVGCWNVSAYNQGMMGYKTPNIDRIGHEGAIFTDYCAQHYGNLYHLNAEEEPKNIDYPKTPAFNAKFGPRGVLKCKATAAGNPAPADPRFGAWGK
jgi:arylsulfatase A-like enzyme